MQKRTQNGESANGLVPDLRSGRGHGPQRQLRDPRQQVRRVQKGGLVGATESQVAQRFQCARLYVVRSIAYELLHSVPHMGWSEAKRKLRVCTVCSERCVTYTAGCLTEQTETKALYLYLICQLRHAKNSGLSKGV